MPEDSQTIPAEAVWLPAPKVWRRYNRSDMTLHRWLHDPAMNFPQPTYFGRYRYWRLSDLMKWERDIGAAKIDTPKIGAT